MAKRASRNLRTGSCAVAASTSAGVLALFSSTFFTYCCVIVEPPCTTAPALRFSTMARPVPSKSTPLCR